VSRTDLLARAGHLRAARTPFVFATVVRAQRPTSAKAGDCALLLPDGTLEGFVGGSCAESTVRVTGLRLLSTGHSTLLRITPSTVESEAAGAGDGLLTVHNPCLSGGTLDIFLEVERPPRLLAVFGAAPIARALVSLATAAGWDVRPAGPGNAADREGAGAPVPVGADAVVVASHGRDEEPVLSAALRAGVRYVGLVASRRRGAAVVSELSTTDIEADRLARLHTPAGLDLGARTPAEIAVSILAEIIQTTPPPAPATTAPATAAATSPAGAGAVAPVEVTDPVCGMTVLAGGAAPRAEHAGATWYFCGAGCRAAFTAEPARYLPTPDPEAR
jgi:xanthine dehydrogenase accessory factor